MSTPDIDPTDVGTQPAEDDPDASRPWEAHERPRTVAQPPDPEPVPAASWDPRIGRWEYAPAGPPPVFRPAGDGGDRRGSVTRAGVVGGLVGALIAAALTLGVTRLFPEPAQVVERRLEPPAAIGSSDEGGSIVDIAARARPWVVNVNVQARQQGLFGQDIVQATGSGVLIRSDGHVVTNAHVVADATEVEVTLASGETVPASVVGTDVDTDIAVVKMDRGDLPSAVIGTVADLKVGQLAIAIGSPLGLQQTVTAGIVSALGRTVERQGLPPLVDMVQTDAPITQGNSGGALIDGNGALVGINTAIAASPDVGAEGIAFAIPVDIAKRVADELIAGGRATNPWLGIEGANIDAETARQFGIGEGALIMQVVPDSPADRAGIEQRDIIVGFDGRTIRSMNELIVEIRKHVVGDEVAIDLVRDGDRVEVTATLGDRPDDL